MSRIDISEANAKIPRAARFDDGIIAAFSFTVFFFVLWLIPVGWRAYDVRTSHVLRQEGNVANGEVTKSYPGRGSVSVMYKFSVDGAIYTGSAKMIAADYKVQAPGEKILIRYLPNAPRVNQPVNWEWFSVWEMPFYVLGLGLLAGIGASIVAGWRKRQLARIGVVVEGRVTGCVPKGNRFTTYYECTTDDNREFEGSALTSEECETGAAIPVIYLSSNIKRNDYYPM